mmetsp:Transcript_2666/g.5865  ORF Transcript_2666/g.5865 Transcript_2666/m.5865 type:complete len:213 (-) Transcript_2666:84-722(-)
MMSQRCIALLLPHAIQEGCATAVNVQCQRHISDVLSKPMDSYHPCDVQEAAFNQCQTPYQRWCYRPSEANLHLVWALPNLLGRSFDRSLLPLGNFRPRPDVEGRQLPVEAPAAQVLQSVEHIPRDPRAVFLGLLRLRLLVIVLLLWLPLLRIVLLILLIQCGSSGLCQWILAWPPTLLGHFSVSFCQLSLAVPPPLGHIRRSNLKADRGGRC